MKGSDYKKDKKTILGVLKDVYHANYYLILSLSIIVIIGFFATIFGFIDVSHFNRFDINNIKELDGIDYEANLMDKDTDSPYLVVSGDIRDDIDLVTIQRKLHRHGNISANAYLVDDASGFNNDFDYHTDGLKKYSEYIDDTSQEVTTYENMYILDSEIGAIDEWDITDGNYVEDTYIIDGLIEGDYLSSEKHSFLIGVSEMVLELNKDNEELDAEKILLEFIDGEDKVLYHTGYKDILGKKSLYKDK